MPLLKFRAESYGSDGFRFCEEARSGLTLLPGSCRDPSLCFLLEDVLDILLGRPLEVEVRDSLEKAMKILKQKMSKEGILQEVKRRRFYEKPSVKKKRKMREARKRRRREMKRRTTPK
jgi:small subunit ribosomal protein S21